MERYGISTLYRGRIYKSRLEARWAAFFDLLGWRHEYEPFDGYGWIPDFVIMGNAKDVLVEVKPISKFNQGAFDKMQRGATDWMDAEWDGARELLLVGHSIELYGNSEMITLGWLGSGEHAILGLWGHKFGFCSDTQSFRDRITGIETDGSWGYGMQRPYEILDHWAWAGNAVQWTPPPPPAPGYHSHIRMPTLLG